MDHERKKAVRQGVGARPTEAYWGGTPQGVPSDENEA